MIRVDAHRINKILDEAPSLGVSSGIPNPLYVEVSQEFGYSVELVHRFVATGLFTLAILDLALECLDLRNKMMVFHCEGFSVDPFRVMKIQQYALLLLK